MANVAHQIGTPLNLVSGHVQLLLHEMQDPTLRRRLEIVDAQVQRVVSAVRDLLERARPRHDRKVLDIRAMLGRLGDAMRPRLASTGVTLDLRIPPELPPVVGDETQLELALLNLVTNALDAMPQGGALTLVVEALESSVRIDVRDTGAGIPPEIRSHIFEPWVTTKPSGRGSGLGLSIAKDVIARAGGTIVVSSTAGQGTVFTIDLPMASSDVPLPTSAKAS
jgi:signal transduction histidine kinase